MVVDFRNLNVFWILNSIVIVFSGVENKVIIHYSKLKFVVFTREVLDIIAWTIIYKAFGK